MQICDVEVVKHSRASNSGIEVATFRCRYWRPVHAEVMTHRKFGRNARSSRAVPNNVLLREPIAEPLIYGSNRPGMSAGAELTGWRLFVARQTWLTMARITRLGVRILNRVGLHKQWSNRPLEWFGYIDVLITATDWQNWYALRDHDAAMPEIRMLARKMKHAISRSTPQILEPGEWHLPYIRPSELREFGLHDCKKLSVARCARLSYKPFDGTDTMEAEMARYNKLVVSTPVHASPAEHQATPDTCAWDLHVGTEEGRPIWDQPNLHGNLRGWVQYRKTLVNEWVPD